MTLVKCEEEKRSSANLWASQLLFLVCPNISSKVTTDEFGDWLILVLCMRVKGIVEHVAFVQREYKTIINISLEFWN